jgi:hypothetical protein
MGTRKGIFWIVVFIAAFALFYRARNTNSSRNTEDSAGNLSKAEISFDALQKVLRLPTADTSLNPEDYSNLENLSSDLLKADENKFGQTLQSLFAQHRECGLAGSTLIQVFIKEDPAPVHWLASYLKLHSGPGDESRQALGNKEVDQKTCLALAQHQLLKLVNDLDEGDYRKRFSDARWVPLLVDYSEDPKHGDVSAILKAMSLIQKSVKEPNRFFSEIVAHRPTAERSAYRPLFQ